MTQLDISQLESTLRKQEQTVRELQREVELLN